MLSKNSVPHGAVYRRTSLNGTKTSAVTEPRRFSFRATCSFIGITAVLVWSTAVTPLRAGEQAVASAVAEDFPTQRGGLSLATPKKYLELVRDKLQRSWKIPDYPDEWRGVATFSIDSTGAEIDV